jgi:hypothetical protein
MIEKKEEYKPNLNIEKWINHKIDGVTRRGKGCTNQHEIRLRSCIIVYINLIFLLSWQIRN